MANETIAERAAAAAFKLLNDSSRSKAAMTAAGLGMSQRRSITENTSVVEAAIFRILRDPSRSKSAMTAAGLTLMDRPKP